MSGSNDYINQPTEGNVQIGTTYWPYPPSCYEEDDPCKNCPYEKTCTKRFKPTKPYIPPGWWWYGDPQSPTIVTSCVVNLKE